MALVSVVMAAYNEPTELFCQAMESVLSQSHGELEIIVVLDNPSNDDLKREIAAYAQKDDRVVPVWNEKNLGLAESLNRALSHVRGSYVCRMDSDDVSLPGRIEQQLDYLESNGLDLVGGYVDVIDESGALLYSVTNIPLSLAGVSKALRWNNCVPHPTWLGRREVFEGGYRAVPQSEDYDFLLRASLRGCKIGNTPHVVLCYRQTALSISRANPYRQFLFQQGLSRSYAQGAVANVDELERYVQEREDAQRAEGYSRANATFNQALGKLRSGRAVSGLVDLARIPFISLPYCDKMRRMLLAALAK